MTMDFKQTERHYEGFEESILMYRENMVGKPVKVSKSTITGLTADEYGRYVIPKGTFLYGQNMSLLENSNQVANQVVQTGVNGTITIANTVVITDKKATNRAITVNLYKPSEASYDTEISVSGLTINVVLAYDGTDILTTRGRLVSVINNDEDANNLVVASLSDITTADTVLVVSSAAVVGSASMVTALGSTGAVTSGGTYTGTENQDYFVKVTTAPTATGNLNGLVVGVSATQGGTYTTALTVSTSQTTQTITLPTGATVTFAVTTGQVFTVNEIYTLRAYANGTVQVATTGGSASSETASVDGILLHDVDVSYGDEAGVLVIAGFINLDKIPVEPDVNIKAKLPAITFLRNE